MKRYLILVSILMITTPMIAMEELELQQETQSTQPQQQQPSSQISDRENVFQKALESCCDSSCCAAIKYPLLTVLYSPVFIMNNIRYPNGGRK